jgi:hypothetical protein
MTKKRLYICPSCNDRVLQYANPVVCNVCGQRMQEWAYSEEALEEVESVYDIPCKPLHADANALPSSAAADQWAKLTAKVDANAEVSLRLFTALAKLLQSKGTITKRDWTAAVKAALSNSNKRGKKKP